MLGGAGAGVNARCVVIGVVFFSRRPPHTNPDEAAFMWLSFGSNKVYVLLTLGILVFADSTFTRSQGLGFSWLNS
jgi:hypothetical protein